MTGIIKLTLMFLLLAVNLLHTAMAANSLEGVRVWPSPGSTRLVLDLKQAPDYSYFSLRNPDRLVIDLSHTSNAFDLSQLATKDGLIKKVRLSKPKNKHSTRLVVDLKQQISAKLFSLPPTPPYKDRLVVDLTPKSPQKSDRVVKSDKKDGRNRDIVVAVDAGHGGEDPGSVGYNGSYEKNVTLSLAKLVAELINKEPGMRAVLTRTGDYHVDVNKRPKLARNHKADLFVSIHADAFTSPQPHGASVWVLSMRRANTELGRWMERSEQHSQLLGGVAQVIQDTPNERYLTQALLDMSMDHSVSTSYEIGRDILGQLKKVTKLHKKHPQAASLGVLTSPDIPSVLVEAGFMSNPTEEKNLNWLAHRKKLAHAIADGIKGYFKASPPQGTLWAKLKKQHRTHKVKSGESLSLLAQRYKVRITDIKRANKLPNNTLRIGQVLTIPST